MAWGEVTWMESKQGSVHGFEVRSRMDPKQGYLGVYLMESKPMDARPMEMGGGVEGDGVEGDGVEAGNGWWIRIW